MRVDHLVALKSGARFRPKSGVHGYLANIRILYMFSFRFHSCPHCQTISVKDTAASDLKRREILSQLGRLNFIYGCQWKEQRAKVLFAPGPWQGGARSILSTFYYSRKIKETAILQAVYDNQFFGLVCVDLHTPDELKQSFLTLNTGTIFTKISVDEAMLNPIMIKFGINYPHIYTVVTPGLSGPDCFISDFL